MSKKMSSKDLVADRVSKGLKNYWYPVLPSWALTGDGPMGITRLSENIVVWRDKEGEVHALEDRCPHRGARLSLGWNLGDRLACWYHGVEINGQGVVTDVPAVSDCSLEGCQTTRTYPAKELHGAIFLYFGDEAHPEPCGLTLPEQLSSDEYGSILCTAVWKCHYQYAIDNVMDPMHGAYLHAKSHSMAFGDKEATMRVRNTDTGLVFEKVGQRDVNFDWVEFGDSGSLWMLLSIPYRQNAGPGGSFYIVGFVTPLDEEHCQVFFWRTRYVSGWQRDVWKFMYKNRLEGLHWDVLEQDRIVLEQMAPNARDQEGLYAHDVGLMRIRRFFEKTARDQVKELTAAAGE